MLNQDDLILPSDIFKDLISELDYILKFWMDRSLWGHYSTQFRVSQIWTKGLGSSLALWPHNPHSHGSCDVWLRGQYILVCPRLSWLTLLWLPVSLWLIMALNGLKLTNLRAVVSIWLASTRCWCLDMSLGYLRTKARNVNKVTDSTVRTAFIHLIL